jgi:arylsulfatase A-like enzyme
MHATVNRFRRRDHVARSRALLPTALLVAVLLLAPVAGSAQAPEPEDGPPASRPNIVFLFSDDHAAHALSAYRPHLQYGATLPATPALDRLAADGVLFTHAFVTNSICAPSRATVLTGQYGHLNGVMTNAERLHSTAETFPRLLREAGYETALFGKWHLKADPEGLDHYEILRGQGPYYNPVLLSPGDSARWEGYTSDVITDRALAWLRGRPGDTDRPFLLMLHFNAPHRFWDPGPEELELFADTMIPEPATLWDDGAGRGPAADDPEMSLALDLFDRDLKLEAPADLTPAQREAWDRAYGAENRWFLDARPSLTTDRELRWRYQRYIKDYLRTVRGMDRNVGRVLDALERAGLADETLVVYTSDQGFFLGDHGWFDKRWMYEESLRTPLLVRWPGVTGAGVVRHELVSNLDIAETLLDAGDAPIPGTMQGRSLVPLLRGETPADWRDAVYYQYFAYPDWHMVQRQYGVRTRRYKLIHFYEIDSWELYDLARDPEELHSVHDDPRYADIRARLETRLRELREQFAVPAEDPVPHREFDPDPRFRRPGGG